MNGKISKAFWGSMVLPYSVALYLLINFILLLAVHQLLLVSAGKIILKHLKLLSAIDHL